METREKPGYALYDEKVTGCSDHDFKLGALIDAMLRLQRVSLFFIK